MFGNDTQHKNFHLYREGKSGEQHATLDVCGHMIVCVTYCTRALPVLYVTKCF